ncbi:MAG: hypothetical protein KDK39_01340 [Leptospiraceae bacterium]|nr:hypothetical protein [Leptospiraceae bacterium]
MQKRDLDLRLIRHLIGDPGGTWSLPELQAIYGASRSAVYRNMARLMQYGLVVQVGPGYALNPNIVGELYGQKTRMRAIAGRINNENIITRKEAI